jgi:cell division protein FtsX
MNHPLLTIIAIALMAPFTVLVVALNMKRSNQRYLSKLKQRADKKQNRKNQ